MTSLPISPSLRLGFGCSGAWAQPWFPAREAQKILRLALESGVRHVDTAGFYANGEAERRLGRVLADFSEPVFVSTKTGTRYYPGGASKDFSERAIRADVEASLQRLGLERIDLVYLHGPSASEQEAGLEVLSALKREGKVGLSGICGEGEGLARSVATGAADVIMGVYNLFRREHADVFRQAKARGIGTVAIAPLAQGLYREDFFRPRSLADGWGLARALVKNRSELARAREAREILSAFDGWSPAQQALSFTLANPDIDVAVTSTTKPAHLLESVAAASRALPPEILQQLREVAP